ncbi:LacI family DNA-binding transcriptional regulator [Agromyces mangrovi Wang et al. 2018]|uniref:LacI family DNA-binding transcriptional regulator n=1 Tax=Agromyces mangrovi TaxID=1858653 RepID=UPI002573E177|nr:LacI family DNA-binding transcriptional regulator [Agromyces mangrovi]BDZ65245.1 LacI family transcriptional regulator [Agromyces mangrovi]
MPSIADVARLSGVSKATASRALSGRGAVSPATRDRVVAAASEIGYIASPNAASLVTGRSKSIGVLIRFVNRWYFGEVLEGLERAMLARGYDLVLYNLAVEPEARRRIFEYYVQRRRVDAVIGVDVDLSPDESDRLARTGRPVVTIGGTMLSAAVRLAVDHRETARLATRHLLHLGHRDIVLLGGEEAERDREGVQGSRVTGFREAMAEAGVADAPYLPTEYSMSEGFSAALQLLGDPAHRPTAVFAACDEIAFGTYIAARRLGLSIPADLSIIGIDGHENAGMFGLTTVEQRPVEQGEQAVRWAMSLLGEGDDEQAPHDVDLPVKLVVRSSTSAPAR